MKYWCGQTEAYLQNLQDNADSMQDWQMVNYFQLEQLSELIRSDLQPLQHKIVTSLYVSDVHNRDIVDQLVESQVKSVQEFQWIQQLRYYWDDNSENILIKQVNTSLRYGYEYTGATPRMVITPLSDRCWMTLTGALKNGLGVMALGPSATGKQQTIKVLLRC